MNEPTLRVPEAVYRTARKQWRCNCDGSCGYLAAREGGGRPLCTSPRCAGMILAGDRYVEYLGEAAAYQSGTRFCLLCGVAAWREEGDR